MVKNIKDIIDSMDFSSMFQDFDKVISIYGMDVGVRIVNGAYQVKTDKGFVVMDRKDAYRTFQERYFNRHY